MNEASKLPPPEQEIRSDLWMSMSTSQLLNQRDMIIDRLAQIRNLKQYGTMTSTTTILNTLTIALDDITNIIDNKHQQRDSF